MNEFIIGISVFLVGFIGYNFIYDIKNSRTSNKKKYKLDKKYIKKIHDWIFLNFELEKDMYNRQLGKRDVKRFAKLSFALGIKLDDNLDDEVFMKVYQKYCNLLVKKNE